MSHIGRVVVAKTSNAEYIVGVNGVENIVSFEPGGRKQKYDFPFVISMGTKETISTSGQCEGLTNFRLTTSTKAINAANIQMRLFV